MNGSMLCLLFACAQVEKTRWVQLEPRALVIHSHTSSTPAPLDDEPQAADAGIERVDLRRVCKLGTHLHIPSVVLCSALLCPSTLSQ